jgi:hypothetical protein
MKISLDNDKIALLCGDASTEYLPSLSDYRVVQLPHHGKLASAENVFNAINQKIIGNYTFLVSDNTGNMNGGSDNLESSEIAIGKDIRNTNNGNPVEYGGKDYSTVSTARKSYGL